MNDKTLRLLVARVAERIGFRPDAIPYAGAAQAIRARFPRSLAPAEVARRVSSGDAELEWTLLEAVSVGETFFFRHPEHFGILVDYLASVPRKDSLVVWSAGCATGEESYSVAACLTASFPGVDVRILGTDVAARNVLAASRGTYGAWSVRDAGPILFPVFDAQEGDPGAYTVLPRIRACTSFQEHNVLDEPPAPGRFDVVFCRNVLLYFSEDAAARAIERLASALAPGGLLVFGTLDLEGTPPGTERFGPREANIFVKRGPARKTKRPSLRAPAPLAPVASPRKSVKPPPRARSVPPPKLASPSMAPAAPPRVAHDDANIAVHVSVLSALERGDAARAEDLLVALRASSPDYLPGLFELAVVLARRGQRGEAESIMRDILRRTRTLDAHEVVVGPEELTVAYYRVAAEAYLGFAVAPGGERR